MATSRKMVSKVHFANAVKMYYIDKNGHEKVIYFSEKPEEGRKTALIRTGVFFALLIVLVLGFFELVGILPPFKSKGNYPKQIIVEDNAGILGSSEYVYALLEDFYERTGLVPGVVTVTKEEVMSQASSSSMWYSAVFGSYAKNEYSRRYKDTKHWLLVFSVSEDKPGEITWKEVSGNNTTHILTESYMQLFTNEMTNSFRKGLSVDETLTASFETASVRLMKGDFDFFVEVLVAMFPFGWAVTAFIVYVFLKKFYYNYYALLVEKNSFKTDDEPAPVVADDEHTYAQCPFCGYKSVSATTYCVSCGKSISSINEYLKKMKKHKSMWDRLND